MSAKTPKRQLAVEYSRITDYVHSQDDSYVCLHCKNKLVVLTTEWLRRDSGYGGFALV